MIILGAGTASGCAPSDNILNGIPDLNADTAPESSYNCMGYAFGKQAHLEPIGYYDYDGATTEETYGLLENMFGDRIRLLDGPEDTLFPGETMIAMNCSANDFHFIKRDDDGSWSAKIGRGGPLKKNIPLSYVANKEWYSFTVLLSNGEQGNTPNYDSGPLFFAYRK